MISYESNKVIVMVLDYIYIIPAAMSKSVNKASELFCKKPEQKLPNGMPLSNGYAGVYMQLWALGKYKVGTVYWLINAEIKQTKYFLAYALSISKPDVF